MIDIYMPCRGYLATLWRTMLDCWACRIKGRQGMLTSIMNERMRHLSPARFLYPDDSIVEKQCLVSGGTLTALIL